MSQPTFRGMVELIGEKRFGFLRELRPELPKGDDDSFVSPPVIQEYHLRDGLICEGTLKPGRKGDMQVDEIESIMGGPPDEWREAGDFDSGSIIYPEEKLQLVPGDGDPDMRVVDLVTPIGKGQRALIVSPPRAGKTVLLKKIAGAVSENHPEVELATLLVDERPEEVTDFRRSTDAQVFASSNDREEDNHVRVSTLALEYTKRMTELGRDVVLLLDSITRLGRTFNLHVSGSGRTLSGGLDANALKVPRQIFGAARNVEGGGSLTIIATALVETGSRMDDVIFEEFKGTGNSEIVLERELADKRIFPAINLQKSGTRNEERLIGSDRIQEHHRLMRALNSRRPLEAMQGLLKQIRQSPDNEALLDNLMSAAQ